MELDHVLFAVTDLEAAAREFDRASGCRRWMAGDIAIGARRTGSCRSDRATWN